MRGTGDALCGERAHLDSYVQYYEDDGYNVELYRFDTTSEEEKEIAQRIEERGGTPPFRCSVSVSMVLKGIGPFEDLKGSFIPDVLANQLKEIQEKQQENQPQQEAGGCNNAE